VPTIFGVTTLELLGSKVDPAMGKLKPLELLILWKGQLLPQKSLII
jgi:hypothetical protein